MIRISYVISFRQGKGLVQRRRFFDPRTASRWMQDMFKSYKDFKVVSVVGHVHRREPDPEKPKKKKKAT